MKSGESMSINFKKKNNFNRYSHVHSELKSQMIEEYVKYSIVIPTFERPELLQDTLESAIAQKTKIPYEIIVVDNHSEIKKENLEKVIQKYNSQVLFYINQENIGMVGNWNRGVELAHGEYVTILHDDDWLESNFIETIDEFVSGKKSLMCKPYIRDYRKDPSTIKSGCKKLKYVIRNAFDRIGKNHNLNLQDFYFRNPSYGTLGVVYHKETMIQLGGFDEDLYPVMDFWFNTLYCAQNGTTYIKQKLCNYRIDMNESFKCAKQTPYLLNICRKQMLGMFPKLEKFKKYRKMLYVYDIKNNENAWNIEIPKPLYYQKIAGSVQYKYFCIKMKLYILLKM